MPTSRAGVHSTISSRPCKARTERPDSDIDVLLVVASQAAKSQVEDAKFPFSAAMRQRFGNHVNVITLTTKERIVRKGKGFVGEAEKEGEPLHKVRQPGDLLFARHL